MKKGGKLQKNTHNIIKSDGKANKIVRNRGKHGSKLQKTSNKEIKTYSQLTSKKRLMVDETVDALINCRTKEQQAEYLGISVAAIYNRLSKYPQINEKLQAIEKDYLQYAKRKIHTSAPIAADKLAKLTEEAESENIQLQAANSVLDRAGIVKPQPEQKTQINVFNAIKKDKEDFDI